MYCGPALDALEKLSRSAITCRTGLGCSSKICLTLGHHNVFSAGTTPFRHAERPVGIIRLMCFQAKGRKQRMWENHPPLAPSPPHCHYAPSLCLPRFLPSPELLPITQHAFQPTPRLPDPLCEDNARVDRNVSGGSFWNRGDFFSQDSLDVRWVICACCSRSLRFTQICCSVGLTAVVACCRGLVWTLHGRRRF